MAPRSLDAIVEAVLFASEEALSPERLAAALERQDATPGAIAEAVGRLNDHYRQAERSFEIVETAGGYKLLTLPEYNSYIRRALRSRSREKLSQAALETVAVIAYRQPVTRADIENIRGVEAGPLLRALVDRGLVRIVGRDESLGHPLLYGTTKLFLELFGLRDLEALPRVEELTKAGQELVGDEAASGEDAALGEANAAAELGVATPAVSEALAAMSNEHESAPVAEEATEAEALDELDRAAHSEETILLADHQPADSAAEDEPSEETGAPPQDSSRE
jgi:segregation and condensation protein B